MLEAKMREFQAKAQLHRALLHAHIQRDIEERRYFYELWCLIKRSVGDYVPGQALPPEPKYLGVLKLFYKAHEDIIRIQLFELEQQVLMFENMLKEAERAIVVPTGHSGLV
jgi:hypothetical protein